MDNNKFKNNFCRVCGLIQLDSPWGDDGKSPNFEICPCCGVEFGYEDCLVEGIKKFRNNWVANDMRWNEPIKKPKNWSFVEQYQNVPDEFR